MIHAPEKILYVINAQCDEVIDRCLVALGGPLETTDDTTDSTEAREQLTHALAAAKLLRKALSETYDFVYGFAEPKEEHAPAN